MSLYLVKSLSGLFLRRRALFFFLVVSMFLFSCGLESDSFHASVCDASENNPHADGSSLFIDQEDVESIDRIVKAIYTAITFQKGSMPNMNRLRSLFTPNAQFIRIAPDGVHNMDVDGFVSSFGERVKTGVLKSFYEGEIFRKVNAYGSIAQVFSTYKKGMNTDDPKAFGRGINSILLYHDGERWWISSIMWEDERSDNPIPEEYLR